MANIFLSSAMEQFGEEPTTIEPPNTVMTPDDPTEVDTKAQLDQLETENDELTSDLVDVTTDHEELVADRIHQDMDNIQVAVESLQMLGKVVSASMANNHYNPFTNAGYAMALEGICNTVHIKNASLSAALEANEIAAYDENFANRMKDSEGGAGGGASEKSKSQGVFATVRDKIRRIWQGMVKMAKNFAMRIQNNMRVGEIQRLISYVENRIEKLYNVTVESKEKVAIKDEKFMKYIKCPTGTTVNRLMMETMEVVVSFSKYVTELNTQGAKIIELVKAAPSDSVRESIQNTVWRLAEQFEKAIGGRTAVSDPKKFIDKEVPKDAIPAASPPLTGGLSLWSMRTQYPNAVPKVEIGLTHLEGPYLTETTGMESIDFKQWFRFKEAMEMNKKEGMWSKVGPAMQKLQGDFPSSWRNSEKIEDAQKYATAAMGYIIKTIASISSTVMHTVLFRYLYGMYKWADLTMEAHGAKKEPAAGAAPAEGGEQAQANPA